MLTLILGRSGSGKTGAVLSGLCTGGAMRPQILMVPEQQSHEVERRLCAVGGNGVSQFAEVLSFSSLTTRLFQAGGGLGVTELDAGGRILLMHRAVRMVAADLTVYGQSSLRPPFLSRLLSAVDELKSCVVSPAKLMEVGDEMGGEEGARLCDLARIALAYDGLTAQSALDPRDRLSRATEALHRSQWAVGKDFWLDGFTDFTAQQIELLALLLAQSNELTISLTCGALNGEEDIFTPARRTALRLIRMAKEAHIPYEVRELDAAVSGHSPALGYLERNLFATQSEDIAPDVDGITVFSGLTARSEVEWTASKILRLVREEGYRFREIGVVARNFEGYRALIGTIFPRYDVPVFNSVMTDILEKPILSLVTTALDIVSWGYRYEDVFRYLKTGLTDLSADDVDVLENYVVKWNPRGSQWTAKKGFTLHPRGYGFSFEEADTELLERLNRCRLAVVQPLETLRKNRDNTAAGQAKALFSFLEQIGVPQRFLERVEGLRLRGEPQLADEYRQLWAILCGGLEQCAALLGDTPMELEEFSQLFRLVLSQYDVGSIPVSLDRVTAGETTRLGGHRVRALFFLGVEDGSVPMVTSNDGLISDDDRSLLRSYGLELNQTGEELLTREMTTVYQMCALPTDYLAITYPRQGDSGEERRPAFLVARVRALFHDLAVVREEDLDGAFRLSAPRPALEQAGQNPAVQRALEQLPEFADQITRLRTVTEWQRGRLSPQAVADLYGKKVPMSASRMDKYKSCHFSYFMNYGLKARARRSGGFAAPEYGTFVHYVLEHVLADARWIQRPREEEGLSDEARKLLRTLVDETVAKYVDEELGGLEGQTDRFRYLFRRLLRAVRSVVENAAEELSVSQFQPVAFEFGFAREGDLPPVEMTVDGMTISISGFVDRVDGWERDGRLYLRVVDYKTGRKSFDLTEIWNGLGLQMLLYLFTLQDKGESVFHQPVDGAGVLYFPARDVVAKGSRDMTESERKKLVDKELIRRGIILDDAAVVEAMEHQSDDGYRFLPLKVAKKSGAVTGEALVSAERFGKLQKHIERVLTDICEELTAGNITADPYWRDANKNACHYCDYADACQFEEGRGGDCRRYLTTVKPDDFWENLGASEENDQCAEENEQ